MSRICRIVNTEKNGNNVYVVMLNKSNAQCSALTSAQHTALALIAGMRHRMHCMSDWMLRLPKDEVQLVVGFFDKLLPILLRGASLPPMEIHIDEVKESLKGGEEYMTKAAIELVNSEVEDYLERIDGKYGTAYCPTGIRRMRRLGA